VSDTVRINGRVFPLAFAAWDANTYKHPEGCLTYSTFGYTNQACQCGALERTSKILHGPNGIQVVVPAAVWNTKP
jgi:hypothetical protein